MDYATSFKREFAELNARYNNIAEFIREMSQGRVRSLIVNGPPGVGKSFVVGEQLTRCNSRKHKIVSGHMTLLSLYAALYAHKDAGSILVLDDVDSVFTKVEGLNLLKAAMDTKEHRNIHWESSSAMLNQMGLPTSFLFNGAVILISNVGFGGAVTRCMAHLNALKDRSYCIPVANGGEDSCFKQVAYMVIKRKMLSTYNLTDREVSMLLDYIAKNRNRLYTVSLRTMIKLADIYKMNKRGWRAMADAGLLKAVA
jgi:hypothetical protein